MLFRMHSQLVAALLVRFGVRREDLDDSVQEVFVIAHRKGGYQPGPAQPTTWLSAIAVHVARTMRRNSARRSARTESYTESEASEAIGPERSFESRRSLERIHDALAALDFEHRAAFVLYELEGQSCETIAETLEIPIGTVYSRLHYARRKVLETYRAAPHTSPLRKILEGS